MVCTLLELHRRKGNMDTSVGLQHTSQADEHVSEVQSADTHHDRALHWWQGGWRATQPSAAQQSPEAIVEEDLALLGGEEQVRGTEALEVLKGDLCSLQHTEQSKQGL